MIDKRKSDPKKLGGKRGVISVEIEKELYLRITNSPETEHMSIRKWVNKLIEDKFKKDDFLKTIHPGLTFLSCSEDLIMLREQWYVTKVRAKSKTLVISSTSRSESVLIVIVIQKGKLWCDYDKSFSCKHIGYSLMLSQTEKIKTKIKSL